MASSGYLYTTIAAKQSRRDSDSETSSQPKFTTTSNHGQHQPRQDVGAHNYLLRTASNDIYASLTVGSAVGSIRELFAKVKAIDAKHGKFDILLCTGDFFGPVSLPCEDNQEDEVSRLLSGQIEREHRLSS